MLKLQLDSDEIEQVVDALNIRIGELKREVEFVEEKMNSARIDSDFEGWARMAGMRADHISLLRRVLAKLGERDA